MKLIKFLTNEPCILQKEFYILPNRAHYSIKIEKLLRTTLCLIWVAAKCHESPLYCAKRVLNFTHKVLYFTTKVLYCYQKSPECYGVATSCRLVEIIRLFCKKTLQKRLYSAEETYNFKQPTNRSHPISKVPDLQSGSLSNGHVAVCCSVLQCGVVCCSVLWFVVVCVVVRGVVCCIT